MSNIAALCYSDATHWWMSNTPLQSSHTHSLTLSLGDCTSFIVSWLGWGVTWKKGLTLVEHRISAASGYKDPPGFAAIGWGISGGGFHDSAAALWQLFFFFFFLSICQHTTYLFLSANLCPSVSVQTCGGWFVGIKADHDIPLIPEILQTCNVADMAYYGRI